MAKKTDYIVVSGCVQDGRRVVCKGQPYSPASADIEAALLESGVIALASDPLAKQALKELASRQGSASAKDSPDDDGA